MSSEGFWKMLPIRDERFKYFIPIYVSTYQAISLSVYVLSVTGSIAKDVLLAGT